MPHYYVDYFSTLIIDYAIIAPLHAFIISAITLHFRHYATPLMPLILLPDIIIMLYFIDLLRHITPLLAIDIIDISHYFRYAIFIIF
jgi:hypothetical protein